MKVKKIWFRADRLVTQIQPVMDQDAKRKLQLLRKELLTLLTKHRFIGFQKHPHLYFDNKLNGLWLLYQFKAQAEEMFRHVANLKTYVFRSWTIPSLEQLRTVAEEPLFRDGKKLKGQVLYSSTQARGGKGYHTVTMGSGQEGTSQETCGVIPFHPVSQRDIFSFLVANSLVPSGIDGVEEKLKELYTLTMALSKKGAKLAPPSMRLIKQQLLEGDYLRARLPVLEPSYLYDMSKGLWELHQPVKPPGTGWVEVELEEPWEARNPEMDVRDGVVAIDFGTSSTVVACREHGQTTLLRVGLSDLFQKPRPEDYQNPTILAFINLPELLVPWHAEAYRPLTRWDHFKFSHEALEMFRANEADQRIVASILTAIKQWPLNASEERPLRLTDQETGTELEVPLATLPSPVPGQPLAISEEDPFDPIELYAYYLGLFINHRSNGLFLEYFMTFPITYPREVKRKILSAFARGLQRSLPAALLASSRMSRFSVREEASEPAAYAACALTELQIKAAKEGTAYAVFDFGGGSTDFDFGIFRLPKPDEEKRGFEKVIHHFGASGDMYLGGENLVAHIAFLAFLQNLELCRQHHISFTRPPETERFPGDELFIDHSNVAQTNSTLLAARVRFIWEAFNWDVDPKQETLSASGNKKPRRRSDVIGDVLNEVIFGNEFIIPPEVQTLAPEKRLHKIDLELLTRDRKKVAVTFEIDQNRLNHFLVQRVGKGIQRFFIAMKQAFESREMLPDTLHILQAGNASRSLLVQSLFAAILQEKMVGWDPPVQGVERKPGLEKVRKSIPFPRFIVHRPPVGDKDNPYRPTAKTGVAIGLLKLIPGEKLMAIGPNAEGTLGEAPFRLYVGRIQKELFFPVLHQNGPYNEWEELGVPTRDVFIMVYSTSPQAGLGNLPRGSVELKERQLEFLPGLSDKKLFIQAVGPYTVDICLADSAEQISRRPEEVVHREIIKLT
ncbi:MAG: hypothetical protein HQL56_01405 [Magnetococcales bacterium]|nr:hypothetical protein [Magnetococcales bacterium]